MVLQIFVCKNSMFLSDDNSIANVVNKLVVARRSLRHYHYEVKSPSSSAFLRGGDHIFLLSMVLLVLVLSTTTLKYSTPLLLLLYFSTTTLVIPLQELLGYPKVNILPVPFEVS